MVSLLRNTKETIQIIVRQQVKSHLQGDHTDPGTIGASNATPRVLAGHARITIPTKWRILETLFYS